MADESPARLLAMLNAAVNEVKREYEIDNASIWQKSPNRVIIDISHKVP